MITLYSMKWTYFKYKDSIVVVSTILDELNKMYTRF